MPIDKPAMRLLAKQHGWRYGGYSDDLYHFLKADGALWLNMALREDDLEDFSDWVEAGLTRTKP